MRKKQQDLAMRKAGIKDTATELARERYGALMDGKTMQDLEDAL